MSKTIGFIFILSGFSCYFFASKIWVEADNYFRLISIDEKRRRKFQGYSLLVGFLGLILYSFGLFETSTKNAFNEEASNLKSFIETLMFFFYHSLFIWFNIFIVKKYFQRDSIIGIWFNQNFEIVFNYYSILYQGSGEGEFKHLSLGNSKIYKFSYSVDYKKMRIKITWKKNYGDEQKDIPTLVFLGNSEYKYKMKNKLLFIDDSIGYMKSKI